MNIYDIKLGSKIDLEILDENKRIVKRYSSFLIEIDSIEKVLVASPMMNSNFIYLRKNSLVRFVYFNGHDVYGSICTTISNLRTDNQNAVFLKFEEPFIKIQRRGYYRLDCLIDTDFLPLDVEQLDKTILTDEFHKCISKNISGSGICISTEEPIEEGQIIKLSVHLSDEESITPLAQIMRKEVLEISKGDVFNLGGRFIKISDTDRNLIIKYVFEQQRKLLKKDIKGI